MSPHDVLLRWVQTPSLSGEEHDMVARAMTDIRDLGFSAETVGNNIVVRRGTPGGHRLLLASHLDTVPVGHGWTHDPYPTAWDGDRLFGRGANDAKGCATAMLFAFATAEIPTGAELLLILAAEEENGGENGVRLALQNLGPIQAGIVGEPTLLRVCDAQRGMVILKIVCEGDAGHVAHAQGRNAIHQAASDIQALQSLTFPPHERLGQTVAQVVTIEGGTSRNMIPDRCEYYVDFRTTPGLTSDDILTHVKSLVQGAVTVFSDRYPACATPGDHPIRRACLKGSRTTVPVGSPTVSDWAFLKDIPAVKMGPGDSHRSHTADEYLLAGELQDGIETYVASIEAYFHEVAL